MKKIIAEQIKKENSVWWDNVQTKNITETRKDILTQSFKEAIISLENQLGNNIMYWNWGKVHTLEHPHPLGTVAALKKYFNVGPFPMKGAREVIDNRGYLYDNTGDYIITPTPITSVWGK